MRRARLAGAVLVLLAAAACLRGSPSSRPPIHPNPSMDDQPKVLAQSESRFFYDGASMRPPVPGTIARGELRDDPAFHEGKNPDGSFVARAPATVDEALIGRGRDRYAIYCQPCHDPRGNGQGILFQRGKVPTASLHDPRIVGSPDGQIFDVITNGLGLMQGYRWPLPPEDRWAIVAYVRTLQEQRREAAAQDAGTAGN